MTDSPSPRLIAIDGGGTRCRILLRDGGSEVAVEAGSSNVSTDFDGTLAEIKAGLAAVTDKARLTVDQLAAATAFVGLAGMTGPEIEARLRARLPFVRMRIEDDRPAALRGALGHKDGVIAHCGTGSFFAAQIGDRMRFSGGWGPVLGDEASAHFIVKAALRLVLAATDGLAQRSPMADHFLDSHGGTAGIVRFAGQARPSELGALAPFVTRFAAEGDALAIRVLRESAAHIAETLTAMGWKPGRAICLTGGIGPHYADHLPDAMRADLATPEATPLLGALTLAEDLAREDAS